MGNEQSTFPQKHLVHPAEARSVQEARDARAANLVSQQQSSVQHRRKGSKPSPNEESAKVIMSPSQRSSGQQKTPSPARSVNEQSNAQYESPPSRKGSRSECSKSKSKSSTPSKKSASQQPTDSNNNEDERPRSRSHASSDIRTSPKYYPATFEDDTSSEGSDDPNDPCLEIRHGRRRLREVLKELQESHRLVRAELTDLETENGRLQGENQRLQDAYQDLQNDYGDLVDENDHFRFVNSQLDADNQSLREEIQDLRAGAREAATRLDELHDVIDALRQTNGDPQNENADLRTENGNLRNQIQGLWTENHQLRGDNNRLHDDIHNLRKQLRRAAGTEDEANRLREQVRDAADATGENNDLHEQLEDLDVELRDTYAHLNRANNEITRLQAIIDWLLQEGSDRASSHPTTPSRSTPRCSSASRSASSPHARDRTPDSAPIPSPSRGGRNVRTAAAPTRRMNTRSQVTGDANSRTPPPELFSPQRARQNTAAARTQRGNASKPAGVSKTRNKAKKGRK